MLSPVGCVRFGEGTLATYVLQVVTFGFVLVFDIHTFILRANRALATYKANLLIKAVLYSFESLDSFACARFSRFTTVHAPKVPSPECT